MREISRILTCVTEWVVMGRSVFGEVERGDELTWVHAECLADICMFYYSINVAN